jgi:hypothetical protein
MRGMYSLERYEDEITLAKQMISEQSDARWGDFLAAWNGH